MTEFHKFFTIYENYYWQFESDFALSDEPVFVISIRNGNTIIYMDELLEMITFLEPQGIPLLSPLLLALTATNANAQESLNKIRSILNEIDVVENFKTDIISAFDFLQKLTQLPLEYKKGKLKRLVLQTIFKNCHNMVSSTKARLILKQHKRYAETLESRLITEKITPNVLFKEIKVLSLLNYKFLDAHAIIEAIQNLPDYDEISSTLEEEILESDSLADKPVDFIEQLIRDERTFQVGSLIKRLWASLQIPFHHNIPSGQPLGGISDLTNKGSFDKLLISEFANDEDVFISRIANNEALYIEREIPPQQDKITRIFLIDTSLKNWGTPKILSYAVSIAILKHPKNDINCKFYLVGNSYEEIHLEDVGQVVSSMNFLSGNIDASLGLEQYFSDHQKAKNTELFLLTSVHAMQTTALQKVIFEYRAMLSFLVLSDIDGNIHLYKYKNQNKKHIQSLTLPLENLWERKQTSLRKKAQIADKSITIPILYPVSKNNSYTFTVNGDYYIYNRGCLYKFQSTRQEKGFELLTSRLDFSYGEYTILKKVEYDFLVYFDYEKEDITYCNLQTNKQESYAIKNINFRTSGVHLFTYKNKLYMHSEHKKYEVVGKSDVLLINNNAEIDTAYQKHMDVTSEFKNRIRKQRRNYDVIVNLYSVSLNSEYSIVINNFYLSQSGFYNLKTSVKDGCDYDANVNLILKDVGANRLSIIKIIKENTDLSLSEVNNLIGNYRPVILQEVVEKEANALKILLENNGAICYTTNVSFGFQDGSKIALQNGILIFKSSDKKIPVFYIPFILGQGIAFATDHEFAGSEYFLPNQHTLTQIIVDDFFKKYINPFLEIIHNVTAA